VFQLQILKDVYHYLQEHIDEQEDGFMFYITEKT